MTRADVRVVSALLNAVNRELPTGYYAVARPYLLMDPDGGPEIKVMGHVSQKDWNWIRRAGCPCAQPDVVVMRSFGNSDAAICAVKLHAGSAKDRMRPVTGKLPLIAINVAGCLRDELDPIQLVLGELERYLGPPKRPAGRPNRRDRGR